MGPAIFKKKLKSGEDFSIRLLPLGGFCAFEGEDGETADENAFSKKKPWQRILVLLAGATMNYLLALLVIIFSFGVYGQQVMGAKYADNYYPVGSEYYARKRRLYSVDYQKRQKDGHLYDYRSDYRFESQ